MKLTTAEQLAVLLLLLNVAICIAYIREQRWSLALYWLGASIIGGALLWQSIRRLS